MGQSAGASTTASLMEFDWGPTGPPFRAAALFSGSTQVIRQSYGNFSSWNALALSVGCSQTAGSTLQLACMKSVSATALMNATGTNNLVFLPVDDDITRSSTPAALTRAGKVANVPILAGTMQNDGSLFAFGQLNFDEWIQSGGITGQLYGFNPTLKGKISLEDAHRAYPQYILDPLDAIQAAFRDYVFLCSEQSVLKQRIQTFPSTPIWRSVIRRCSSILILRCTLTPCLSSYSFGTVNPGLEHGLVFLKAFHGSDIPFGWSIS